MRRSRAALHPGRRDGQGSEADHRPSGGVSDAAHARTRVVHTRGALGGAPRSSRQPQHPRLFPPVPPGRPARFPAWNPVRGRGGRPGRAARRPPPPPPRPAALSRPPLLAPRPRPAAAAVAVDAPSVVPSRRDAAAGTEGPDALPPQPALHARRRRRGPLPPYAPSLAPPGPKVGETHWNVFRDEERSGVKGAVLSNE